MGSGEPGAPRRLQGLLERPHPGAGIAPLQDGNGNVAAREAGVAFTVRHYAGRVSDSRPSRASSRGWLCGKGVGAAVTSQQDPLTWRRV